MPDRTGTAPRPLSHLRRVKCECDTYNGYRCTRCIAIEQHPQTAREWRAELERTNAE